MTTPASSPSLKALLNPRSVAVIGASEDQTKFGGRLYKTLLQHHYDGAVYPINPGRDQLFGLKTYPSVAIEAATRIAAGEALPKVTTRQIEAEKQAA